MRYGRDFGEGFLNDSPDTELVRCWVGDSSGYSCESVPYHLAVSQSRYSANADAEKVSSSQMTTVVTSSVSVLFYRPCGRRRKVERDRQKQQNQDRTNDPTSKIDDHTGGTATVV